MTTLIRTACRELLMVLVLVGPALAAEPDPSTASVLQQMDTAEVNEASGQSLVETGDEMFHATCSQCHDTARATSKRKTYDEWLATVQRMAAKEGANISESRLVPIATYLASLNPTETNEVRSTGVPTLGEVLAASAVSLHATISVLWRNGDKQVEYEGFFPDVWVGAEWRPKNSPFSGQVMACTSCHDDPNGLKIELVEGSFTADLIRLWTRRSQSKRDSGLELSAKAGRFIVPFGAYSGMAHPGVNRTLTNPLMYNMGRRVGAYTPVLPMPYSDEGVDLHLGVPLPFGFQLQVDGYGVNGLQGVGGFQQSRSYRDNNSNTALGGRATLGSSWISIGGSYGAGELQDGNNPEQDYSMCGGDVTFHYRDYIRAYFEYARRDEDSAPTLESRLTGQVAELEGKIWCKPKITMLVRYDQIDNPPAYGGATIQRVTWGPNITLPGGSLFIINYEQWKLDHPLNEEDVVGARWVVSF